MPNNVFIRTKTIKGKPYAYLVENTWKNGRSRQKVKQYLGRVFNAPPTPKPRIPPQKNLKEVIQALITHELALIEQDITYTPNANTLTYKNKSIVVALNGGFLCDYTLKELVSASKKKNEERPGMALAQAFSDAGLRISQEAFIALYTGVKST